MHSFAPPLRLGQWRHGIVLGLWRDKTRAERAERAPRREFNLNSLARRQAAPQGCRRIVPSIFVWLLCWGPKAAPPVNRCDQAGTSDSIPLLGWLIAPLRNASWAWVAGSTPTGQS